MKSLWCLVIPLILVCSCGKREVAAGAASAEPARQGKDVIGGPAPARDDSEEAAVNERLRPSQRPEPRVYPKPKPPEYPTAVTVAGKPGYVTSPYNGKVIDLRDIPPGTLVQDPTAGPEEKNYFRVPAE